MVIRNNKSTIVLRLNNRVFKNLHSHASLLLLADVYCCMCKWILWRHKRLLTSSAADFFFWRFLDHLILKLQNVYFSVLLPSVSPVTGLFCADSLMLLWHFVVLFPPLFPYHGTPSSSNLCSVIHIKEEIRLEKRVDKPETKPEHCWSL